MIDHDTLVKTSIIAFLIFVVIFMAVFIPLAIVSF